MRDYKTSKYTKTIGITPDNLKWIEENKGKKSRSGFLEEVINTFKQRKLL